MATVAKPKLLTAEEFMAADLGDGCFELVRGEVVELPPAMPEHGVICNNVAGIFWNYGRESGYGYSLSNDSAVVTERGPDTVRGPDVCFYSHARWPRSELGNSLPPVPPDVAVEVVSPGNRRGAIQRKVSEYLVIGTLLVWVVYPASRSVAIHRSDNEPPRVFHDGAVIEDLPELPGFRCPVADFFI
ncbi:MAG: Uma2 family endonuclease [Isosphaerales bacterium]